MLLSLVGRLLLLWAAIGLQAVRTETPDCELLGGPAARELSCRAAGIEALDRLPELANLTRIDLTSNNLTNIPARGFRRYPHLEILLLRRNRIERIDPEAFDNMTSLALLELDDNKLTEFPRALARMSSLEELSLSNNRIRLIEADSLRDAKNLLSLDLRGNPISEVQPAAFQHLSRLRKLILSNLKELSEFPSLEGCRSLEFLRLDRARIERVPDELCRQAPKLKSLDLKSNRLSAVPNLKGCRDLRVLDLASNLISSLEGKPFEGLGALHDLLIPNNLLESVPQDAFTGLTKLQVLDLESNGIDFVHPDAFEEIKQLEDLNLGNNIFPSLPIKGLSGLLHLKTFNNPALREFPAPELFPRVRTMVLSYAYHCCSFVSAEELEAGVSGASEAAAGEELLQESVLFPTDNDFDMSLWNQSLTDIWPQLHNLSEKFGSKINELWDNFGTDFTYPGNLPAYVEEYFEEQEGRSPRPATQPARIQCLPQPGPFLPCRDLFDWWTLRCGVWLVFLLAMLGNGSVVFVLVFSRSKMDVPRFLVCNLAAADFFMGLYLGMLAVVDASTLGEFRKYAIPWQMSAGCQLAGFLGVLSSELSVYTLAVITLERNYAITHAMHLNKRLSLKHAGYIMSAGWTFALGMAALPLLGVSDYRKFAICLPFETSGPAAMAYVVFLVLVNGLAFLILMGCYLKMYCAIRGSQAWNSNDSRIAKRMALLVLTDLLCWSPIAFFSLTATFGLQLVSLEQAKVFAVFVLPLNSCCNPFLYAILTKQFKKDCVLICKAIEESRVTRSIGRCRHSSNFSNRLSPANTNSLVDRSAGSRDLNLLQHPHQPQVNAYQQQQATCVCGNSARLILERGQSASSTTTAAVRWWQANISWPCSKSQRQRRNLAGDPYAYRIAAEIQQKQHKRASSMSSSENYSSSRSDSWRQHHRCGIPLRLLDPKRRTSSWLISRKPSQDSNLSSSRNDSSGSGNTASTSTWRVTRSSSSLDRAKPRLTRQMAFQEPDSPGSPGRLAVRLLATIPSAAEMSEQCDEESSALAEKEEEQPDADDDEDDGEAVKIRIKDSDES
ncbi:lutropin-choriogonadotropic hormone receptor [Nasonia vitripennis]|uniref:G-protein coupled receptors family 1 profile domain-containing protein n=1 Tax=Nasonia vitripennis TaxID=7425 RepID=A0A7M7LME5_NASVI|nr:lutropin-choriogonadotropic hormone receptor [Nasonia vitripennis]